MAACPDQRRGVIAHRGRASARLRSSSSAAQIHGAFVARHGPVHLHGPTLNKLREGMVDKRSPLLDYHEMFSIMRAVKLQSVFRGHRSRLLLGAARKQGPRLAATKLQAAFRGHLDRLRAQQALARKVAVLRIQRIQVTVHPARAGGRAEAIASLCRLIVACARRQPTAAT